MALYANLRDYKFSEEVDDIRGSEIVGVDNEKLGKIDDVIFDHATGDMRYVVVDTGGWLRSNKFILPARQVMTETEGAERTYRVSLRKDQIERFPAYEERAIERDEDFRDYERKYEDAYKLTSTGDVLHQQGSANIVTPTPEEMPSGGGGKNLHVSSPKRIATDMPRYGATSDSENVSNMPNAGYDSRPLQPKNTLQPREWLRKEDEERAEAEVSGQMRADEESEPVTMDRSEFLKDGTLRSEYDAPREESFVDRETRPTAASVADDADINGYAPDGGERFRKFQERLRKEREEILRKRERDVRNVA